jgi:hypothetical protein
VITADVAFRQAANAAAAAYAKAPPYLAYRTRVVVDIPAWQKHKEIERAVETRTSDDYAALQDLPRGQHQYAHSFPVIPTFDALSYFRVNFNGKRDALTNVEQVQPITFSNVQSNADVVVVALRYYHAQYAPDSTDAIAHVVLDPLPTLTNGNTSTYFLHDVYIDTASSLPTRVVYEGRDAGMTCDYTVVGGHWLISHMTYHETVYAVLHVARVSFTAEATNSDFAFPDPPTDPRLIPSPAPAPTPSR